MSLTLVFRAIHQLLTPSNSRGITREAVVQSLKSIRDRVISPIGDNIFSVTVEHSLAHHEPHDRHLTQLTVHDTDPLRYYKPHQPSDPTSRANLLEWLKYPGILKIVQLARKLQLEYESLPSESNSQKIRNILSTLTRNSTILARSCAGPLVCSITISAIFSGLQSTKSTLVQPIYKSYFSGTLTFKPILKTHHKQVQLAESSQVVHFSNIQYRHHQNIHKGYRQVSQ